VGQPWQPLEAGDLLWLIAWAAQRQRAVPAGSAAIAVLCEVVLSAQNPDDRLAAATSLARVALPEIVLGEAAAALQAAVHKDENERVRATAFAALTLLQRRMVA
ncbi:MAG: HEAT repeat domain-containing protein, partial [Anaerolineae bacterium]|nr:HEAT repeat domain-containing protein [Anaerolineae bacterium]